MDKRKKSVANTKKAEKPAGLQGGSLVVAEVFNNKLQHKTDLRHVESISGDSSKEKVAPVTTTVAVDGKTVTNKTTNPAKSKAKALDRTILFDHFQERDYFPIERSVASFELETQISEVDLTGVDQLTDLFFWAVSVKCGNSPQCKTLEKLTLQGCLYLTDDAILQISTTFPGLREIDLDGCRKLTEVSIWRLLRSCTKLTSISMMTTDVGVVHLPDNYNGSCSLKLQGCPLIMPPYNAYKPSAQSWLQSKSPYFDSVKKAEDIRQYKVLIATPYAMKDVSLLQFLVSEGKEFKRPTGAAVITKVMPKLLTSNGLPLSLNCADTLVTSRLLLSMRTLFIVPFLADDDPHQSTQDIQRTVFNYLTQVRVAPFIIVGIGKEQQQSAVMETVKANTLKNLDVLKANIEKEIKILTSAFNDHQLPNNFGRQRNLGNLLTTKKNLAVLRERITFVFVNVSKPEQHKMLLTTIEDAVTKLAGLFPMYQRFNAEFIEAMAKVTAKKTIEFENDIVLELRSQLQDKLGPNLRTYKKCLEYMHMLSQIVYIPNRDNIEGLVFPNTEIFATTVNTIVKMFAPKTEMEPIEVNTGALVVKLQALKDHLESSPDGAMLKHMYKLMKSAKSFFDCKSFTVFPMPLPHQPPVPLNHFIDDVAAEDRLSIRASCTSLYQLTRTVVYAILTTLTESAPSFVIWHDGVIAQKPPVVSCILVKDIEQDGMIVTVFELIVQAPKPNPKLNSKTDVVEQNLNCMMWKVLLEQQTTIESFLQESRIFYKLSEHEMFGYSTDADKPELVHSVYFGHTYNVAETCTQCGQRRDLVATLRKMNASCFPTMSSSLILMRKSEMSRQKGCWFSGTTEGSTRIQIHRTISAEEFPSLNIIVLTAGPLNFGVEFINGAKQVFVDFELGTLPDGTQLSPNQQLMDGDILHLDMFWQGDVSVCKISKNGEVLTSVNIEEENATQPYLTLKGPTAILLDVQYIPASSNVRATWERGMRLEAKDRKNPHLTCVAFIEDISADGSEVLIHFDGWGCNFDYWADVNSTDLHPIGYMAHLNKTKNVTATLQAPRGRYEFDWDSYLCEIVEQPVPHELFNEEQTAGSPEFVFSNETRRVLLAAGKYFEFAKGSKGQGGLSVGLGVDRYCKSKYNAFAGLYNLTENTTQINLNAFPNLRLTKFLLTLPSPLDLRKVVYSSCKTLSDWNTMKSYFVCPGTYKTFLHLIDTMWTATTNFNPQLTLVCIDIILNQPIFLPCPVEKLVLESKGVSYDLIESSFRQMLTAYRTVLITQFNEWDVSVVTNIEQPNTMIPKPVMSYVGELGFWVCGAHESSNSQNKQLTQLSCERFLPYQQFITELNFASNNLKTLPQNIFTAFPALRVLAVEKNKIVALPAGISKCPKLYSLLLKQNQLTNLPAELNACTSLQYLDISCNPFPKIPDVVFECRSVIELRMEDIGFESLSPNIGHLESLEVLSISGNLLTDLPAEMSQLKRLTHLDISGVQWIETEDDRKAMLTREGYGNIAQIYLPLAKLNSSDSEVDLFGDADLDYSGTLYIDGIDRLNRSIYSHFPRLGRIPYSKQQGLCPDVLFTLTSLQSLKMNYQAIKEIDERIVQLSMLKELSLKCCPQLENVAPELGNMDSLEQLKLNNCAMLKTPPKEIVRSGFQAIIGYLRRLAQGSVECKRTKLMMVGLGGAGKTSLVDCLTTGDRTYRTDPAEMITDGIDIKKWTVGTPSGDLMYNIWDFAGQSVYYNTHQFFLSNRAVYLLLWNIRLGHEHAGLDFWLSSISCHAPKAPILIVGSHRDQVEKYWMPEVEMRKKYPQIKGFFAVSCYTYEGIQELKEQLIEISLAQKYMGEKIPEAWLIFEQKLLSAQTENTTPVLVWDDMEEKAMAAGIVDRKEILQAVRFLHDLGSIQHFQNEHLRNRVVINPQWIVDAMACIVSVHDNFIVDGWLYHRDVSKIWSRFDVSLHQWLLRLTEEFDLSFPLHDQPANIVPCLLSADEPEYEWPDVSETPGMFEKKMKYEFSYLPAGLFNRMQARLYQYSDSTVIWKKGSLLTKNGHKALLQQISDSELLVTVQGPRPENVLFTVHEVFEGLVSESFRGISYDYFFPCKDCMKAGNDPSMYPASKVRRAKELKAAFLQCDNYFHALPLSELVVSMPPDSTADYDAQLERSIRKLKDLQDNIEIEIVMIYCARDIPDESQLDTKISPQRIYEDLKAAGFKIWYTPDPTTFNLQQMLTVLRQAKIILLGMSNDFVTDESCNEVFYFIKDGMLEKVQLLAMGTSLDWTKSELGIYMAQEVYVNMMDINRYEPKIQELKDTLHGKLSHLTEHQVLEHPPVFISYCWQNSKDAVSKGTKAPPGSLGWQDPRKLKVWLEEQGISCWIDTEQVGNEGLFTDIADGLKHAKLVIVCVSDEYVNSKNCQMEFRFATVSLKLPLIIAVMGTGSKWETSDVGMLSLGSPKFNLQYESAGILERFLEAIKTTLPKEDPTQQAATAVSAADNDSKMSAFQELLELAEKKFLRQVSIYCDSLDLPQYPRLYLLDLCSEAETEEIKKLNTDAIENALVKQRMDFSSVQKELCPDCMKKDCECSSVDHDHDHSRTRSRLNSSSVAGDAESEHDETASRAGSSMTFENDRMSTRASSSMESHMGRSSLFDKPSLLVKRPNRLKKRRTTKKHKVTEIMEEDEEPVAKYDEEHCLRFLCEHESGWHLAPEYLKLAHTTVMEFDDFVTSVAPYMGRLLAILKYAAVTLQIFSTEEGENLKKALDERSVDSKEFRQEYINLRKFIINIDTNKSMGGLGRCRLASGKVLWLCKAHQESEHVSILCDEDAEFRSSTNQRALDVKSVAAMTLSQPPATTSDPTQAGTQALSHPQPQAPAAAGPISKPSNVTSTAVVNGVTSDGRASSAKVLPNRSGQQASANGTLDGEDAAEVANSAPPSATSKAEDEQSVALARRQQLKALGLKASVKMAGDTTSQACLVM